LYISIDAALYLATIFTMVLLTMAASAWVARKTVHMPITSALAHT
jgi:putative ABC transport system permease protein